MKDYETKYVAMLSKLSNMNIGYAAIKENTDLYETVREFVNNSFLKFSIESLKKINKDKDYEETLHEFTHYLISKVNIVLNQHKNRWVSYSISLCERKLSEMSYESLLDKLLIDGINYDDIHKNKRLQNMVYYNTRDFVRNVVLKTSRNISLLKAMNASESEVVNDVTVHMISKMDNILAKPRTDWTRYSVTICNNKIADKFRHYRSVYPFIKYENTGNLPVVFLMGNKSQDYITSAYQSPEDVITYHDMARGVFLSLSKKQDPMDYIACFSLILGIKTSDVISELSCYGIVSVLEGFYSEVYRRYSYLMTDFVPQLLVNESYELPKEPKKLAKNLTNHRNKIKHYLREELSKDYSDVYLISAKKSA